MLRAAVAAPRRRPDGADSADGRAWFQRCTVAGRSRPIRRRAGAGRAAAPRALTRDAAARSRVRHAARRQRGRRARCAAPRGGRWRAASATACGSAAAPRQASRDVRDRRRRGHRRAGVHPGPLRRPLRDRRRATWIGPQSLLRCPGSGDRGVRGLGPWRQGAGSQHTGVAGRRSDHPDRPANRAGADRRLGRHRRQRRDPARRHGRQGRHRRRRRGGRPTTCEPFAIVAGVPARFAALARRPRSAGASAA